MIGQFIINGFITGILYSLLAIGFALVYNTTKIFHIAAAAIYVFAAFMFYLFAYVMGWPLFVAAIVAIILTMGLSWLLEIAVYRPLKRRKSSNNVAMIASIGLMTVIVNLLAMIFGNETKVVDNSIQNIMVYCGFIITLPQKMQLFVGGLMIVVFLSFIELTKWGIRLRALSANSVLYATLGYNSSTVRSLVFLMSGAFIGVASCLSAYEIGLDAHMGMNVLVNALVAMIIGGVGRFGTCVVGGIALGVLQALTVYWFPSNWQNAVTFLLLIILLFLRPQGIAGYKQRTV